MSRRVRGTLFVDYVRMLRARKDINWAASLAKEDQVFLDHRVNPEQWYPMEAFERLGLAILAEIAGGEIAAVKEWGRASIDGLRAVHPDLITVGDARETLMKFHVLRTGFFDFPALTVHDINDGEATVEIAYQMGKLAEEAAANQTLGFFERLLELAEVRSPSAAFASRSWVGDPTTLVELHWE